MSCKTDTIHRDIVLSLTRAARVLPMREADALALLRARGLVRNLAGRSVVCWGDVLDALRAGLLSDSPPPTVKPSPGRRPPKPTL